MEDGQVKWVLDSLVHKLVGQGTKGISGLFMG